jgi:uncharacterized protein YjbI with pentapeptide repeats
MIEIKHKKTGDVLFRCDRENLEGVNLTGANLAGADLSGQDISHACLRNADLHEANLDHAQLVGTCLDDANLSDASLDDADLTDASLQKADLHHAHMAKANMRYTKLLGANLSDACLTGVDLSMADARADLHNADLHNADLRGANLTGANLQQADLIEADLTGATLNKAQIQGARTRGAKMGGAISDEATSRAEATARASMLRHNTGNSNGTNGRSHQPSAKIAVSCPFCDQQQEIPAQRMEHHSHCSKCKERFFVDRLGNATVPRKTAVPKHQQNQWTPENNRVAVGGEADADTWEIPNQWLVIGAVAVVLAIMGTGAWFWF